MDGNLAANSANLSSSFNVTVNNGQEIWLRWVDPDDGSSDHGLAVDDLLVTATGSGDIAPTVSSTTPANGATGVTVGSTVTINFSEDVTTAGTWYNFTCNSVPVDSSATGTGSQRIITPTSSLPFNANCTVTVLAAQVTDLDGTANPMASNYDLAFATEVDNPPTVSSTVPTDGATGVSANTTVTVNFSEGVTTNGTWYNFTCNSAPVASSVTGTGSQRIITPTSSLPLSASCTVTVLAAQVTDLDGTANPMASNYDLAFTVVSGGGGSACSTELFISEYVEGSSNNKAIEIVNVTGAPVDMTVGEYKLLVYFNGASTYTAISLNGTVASGDVFLVCNSSASFAGSCDQTSGSVSFNGNDAVALAKGSTPTLLDVIGQIDYDPGTEWGTGLLSTADNTLQRISTVTAGDPEGEDDFVPQLSAEWNGFAMDTFSGLGSHTVTCVDNPPAVSSTTPGNGATGIPDNTTVTINFSENVTTSGSWYTFTCGVTNIDASVTGTGSQRILTPSSALPFNASCQVTVLASQVTDLDGTADPMASDYVLSFTTAADNPPSVSTTMPVNGATGVTLTANIVVVFSEAVTPTDPWFTLSCAGISRAAAVTGGPQSFTLNPASDFTAGDFCTVTIQAGQVWDQDGIPDALPSSYVFTFLAADGAGGTPAGLGDYERWFGSQHSHTDMDGDDGAAGSTAATAFAYADNISVLQYFIVTPHLHASRSGSATLWYESTYDLIRTQAVAATTADFVAIAGMEVSTLSSGGHWNLFNAMDLVGQDHPDGDWNDSDDYYEHIVDLAQAGETIAAQFNHPKTTDFGSRFDPAALPYVGTLAVSSGPAFSTATDFSDDGGNYQSTWAYFLNMGWKLAPAADQDNHLATWGASSTEYTVVVRPVGTTLNAINVVQGLAGHMTYATEDANMQIGFIANGWSMGQTIGGNSNVSFTIWWNNPSGTITNGNTGQSRTESANDLITNIYIYRGNFTTPVATYTGPDLASGTWTVNVAAVAGDWFVVVFDDTSSFSTERGVDRTWSAPVWYDPDHADTPLATGNPGIYVDDDYTASTAGWGVSRFATIQAGINAAAAGQTVYVETLKAGDEIYAENIVLNKAVTVLIEGSLTLNGSLTISNGTFVLKGGGTYALTGDFTHNGGTFSQSSGTILFNGTGTSHYSGLASTTFYNLEVSPATLLDLGSSPQFNIDGTLTNNGWMRQVKDVPAGQTTSFLNISTNRYYGVDIQPTSADMGQTAVMVRGNGGCTNGVTPAIQRCYDIDPGFDQEATITFYYRDAEESSQTAAYAWHWNGTIWQQITLGRAQDMTGVENNWVQATVSSYSPYGLGNQAPTAVQIESFSVHAASAVSLPALLLVGAVALLGIVALRRKGR